MVHTSKISRDTKENVTFGTRKDKADSIFFSFQKQFPSLILEVCLYRMLMARNQGHDYSTCLLVAYHRCMTRCNMTSTVKAHVHTDRTRFDNATRIFSF